MQLITGEAGGVGREGGAARVGRLCGCMYISTGPVIRFKGKLVRVQRG